MLWCFISVSWPLLMASTVCIKLHQYHNYHTSSLERFSINFIFPFFLDTLFSSFFLTKFRFDSDSNYILNFSSLISRVRNCISICLQNCLFWEIRNRNDKCLHTPSKVCHWLYLSWKKSFEEFVQCCQCNKHHTFNNFSHWTYSRSKSQHIVPFSFLVHIENVSDFKRMFRLSIASLIKQKKTKSHILFVILKHYTPDDTWSIRLQQRTTTLFLVEFRFRSYTFSLPSN